MDPKIFERYKSTVLARRYNSHELYPEDLTDKGDFIYLLYEMLSHEADLTLEGVNFVEDYWGLENAAKMILEYEEWDGDFHKSFKSAKEIVDWINHFKQGRTYRHLTPQENILQDIQNAMYRKYGGKKLGGILSDQTTEYFTSTFMQEEKVLNFLVHMSKGITYLTLTGYEFLNENYGLKYLANRLYEEYPEYVKKDPQKNLDWLVSEKHSFIFS